VVESAFFYVDESPQAAIRFEEEVDESLKAIGKNPNRYRIHKDDIRIKELDRFPFSIYYRVRENEVHVLSIAHNSRRPEFWIDRAE
jgi:toxin ParE1/3/4